MKKYLLLFVLVTIFYISNAPLFAQSTTMAPNYIVIPGVAALPACANVDKGKTVFNTTDKKMYFCDGTTWQNMAGVPSAGVGWSQTGANITNTNTGIVTANSAIGTATNAIFGSNGTGISLQKNNPIIGFNQYRDSNNAQKYLGDGHAMSIVFGPYDGSMVWLSNPTGLGGNLTPSESELMTLTTDGGLIIGPTTSSGPLGEQFAIRNGNDFMAFQISPKGASWYSSNNFSIMPAFENGCLGIGTEDPIAKLHVVGTGTPFFVNNGQYFGNTGGFAPYSGATNAVFGSSSAIFADGAIACNSFIGSYQTVVSSDSRIKNIKGLSNNAEDLARLRKIEITNYTMSDEATWGKQNFKKVIAQQVESVYPEVIKLQTSVIPDIYSLAESVSYDAVTKNLSVTLAKDHNIKIGDKLELVHPEKGKIRAEVISSNAKTFTVKDWAHATDKIFVFGREVNDFRSVDYEALSMLGISAIQALAKDMDKLQIMNEELRLKNEKLDGALKANISDQKNQIEKLKTDFNSRLMALEAALKN
jgi:hypothetical protein